MRKLTVATMASTLAGAITIVALTASMSISAQAKDEILDIDPVVQQSPAWCWLAVGEMVFKHFAYPAVNSISYQCGIAAGIGNICNLNCGFCQIPASSPGVIQNMLRVYPRIVAEVKQNGDTTTGIHSALSGPLSFDDAQDELETNPIIAGISLDGAPFPDHVVLLVGYNIDFVTTHVRNQILIINDPFPYSSIGMKDPYLAAGGEMLQPGQYRIDYAAFRNYLHWRISIHSLTDPD